MDVFHVHHSIRIENEENDEDNQQLDLETVGSRSPVLLGNMIPLCFSKIQRTSYDCERPEFSL